MAELFLLVLLSQYGGMEAIPYPYNTEAACKEAGEKAEDDSGRVSDFVCIKVQNPRR